jgi:N-acetylneuraminic acid mutarotase
VQLITPTLTTRYLAIFGLTVMLTPQISLAGARESLSWRNLPELPQALGGQFVGVVQDHLVVAGGSYFTTPPWEGGKKRWVNTIYTLSRNDAGWRLAGHLPSPLGYGVAITTPAGTLCIGGQTPSGNSKWVLRLRLEGSSIVIDHLPDLPEAVSNMSGALAGDTVYIAGGQSTPESTSALHNFWTLSLVAPRAGWRRLPAWPGPPRIFSVMAASGTTVYLISGAELTGAPGPPVGRKYLTSAYRYSPRQGWRRIADVPQPTVAGVGAVVNGKLLVFGGDDGKLYARQFKLKGRHPGFSKIIYLFDPHTRTWSRLGVMPHSLATTGLATWNHQFVIAGGEVRPGHRSALVMAGHISIGGS